MRLMKRRRQPRVRSRIIGPLPKVGAEIIVVNDERKAREISQMRQSTQRLSRLAVRAPSLATAMLEEETEKKEANLIIKADVGGSREVLEAAVAISGKNISVKVIHSAVAELANRTFIWHTPATHDYCV